MKFSHWGELEKERVGRRKFPTTHTHTQTKGEMSDADVGGAGVGGDGARVKVNIPEEKLAEAGGRADSPEQSISTPSYETQSGFKRLRTTGWEEGAEHGGKSADEAPGTSKVIATSDEVRQLQERTKRACSQLAEVIIQLRRERCVAVPSQKRF